jgi:5-methylcytosine-specific restriction endonuclease McrA
LVRENKNPTQSISGREPIPDDVKMFVWNRDGGKCVRCGSNQNLEFDHIIPLSRGGSNTARNLQLLCERCNRSKGANLI